MLIFLALFSNCSCDVRCFTKYVLLSLVWFVFILPVCIVCHSHGLACYAECPYQDRKICFFEVLLFALSSDPVILPAESLVSDFNRPISYYGL